MRHYASAQGGSSLKERWPGLAAGYVGTVVGAGFASGREIAHFFAHYGQWGLAGAALAGLLFGWTGSATLRICTVGGHRHYGTLLRDVCGPVLGPVLDRLGFLFIFVGLIVVTAGAGALGSHVQGWPRWWGVLSTGGALALSLTLGRRSYVLTSLAVVPVILLICMVAGASALHWPLAGAAPLAGGVTWPLSALLYVAYNLLMGVAGLCAVADGSQTVRDAVWAGWVGGIVLGLLCVAVTLGLLARPPGQADVELPLAMALPVGLWRSVGYPVALFAALWTTGSAAALALGDRLNPHRPRWPAVAAAAVATPCALVGLVPLVAVAYPLMGYAGVPLLAALALRGAGTPGQAGQSGGRGRCQRLGPRPR